MLNSCGDCLGIRSRTSALHQTWKWLHQTITLHEYMISLTTSHRNDRQTTDYQ
ncbi:hypothetical protein RN001_015668 [Aquatica leii]|uniref:Uncharacterized protein n=1 Tax=Aquatica leii TaxID=1421715 RepID=A0AAN7SB00_9COLE|nr:hypothetical protein RN001_015668 [Aquatica leii]